MFFIIALICFVVSSLNIIRAMETFRINPSPTFNLFLSLFFGLIAFSIGLISLIYFFSDGLVYMFKKFLKKYEEKHLLMKKSKPTRERPHPPKGEE